MTEKPGSLAGWFTYSRWHIRCTLHYRNILGLVLWKFAVLRPRVWVPNFRAKPEGAAKRPPWQSRLEPAFAVEAAMS